jgi:hypothetical protein
MYVDSFVFRWVVNKSKDHYLHVLLTHIYFRVLEGKILTNPSVGKTASQRFWGARLAFITIIIILFLVGFFVLISNRTGLDFDFFKKLLTDNRKR